ncbi:MAG: threonine--tRNA ligase [Candidatus Saccharimonadales bacterium]
MVDQKDKLHAMRHSLAHIMATAITTLWPETKLGVGPVVENGFYYDIDLGDTKISEDDFKQIETEMRKIISENQPFERSELPIDEAIQWAEKAGQTYKNELLNDLKRAGTTVAKDLDKDELGTITEGDSAVESVSFYRNGSFIDLCRGPHVESTGKVGAFKLMRVAGAYWRGKETNPQMQRLYGVAFATEKELRQYLHMLEEAKKRDHRKLGAELDLFVISPLIGAGLPLFTPRGTILRDELDKFAQSFRLNRGYQKVWIPHIAKLDTYKTSGHYEKFPELLKFTSTESGDELALKPVNCPHHTQIYASKPRSYKDLPVKYLETTTVYRDERSGELGGLSRVRAITQDDSHVFCSEDQVETVFSELLEDARTLYSQLDLELSLRLSFRDESDSYLGDPAAWDRAEAVIEKLAKQFELEYEVGIGEAAIYGPKMDFMATDALGRKTQLATVQLDYAQPERFELEYTGEDGEKHRPVMVHCALLGSLERFLSIYIEHVAGKFPVWLAPEQVRLITVNQEDKTVEFAEGVAQQAKDLGLRVHIDNDNVSVGKKIRNSELMKIPYTIVIGEKEIESGQVTPRVRSDMEVLKPHDSHAIDNFLKTVSNEMKSRTTKTSL